MQRTTALRSTASTPTPSFLHLNALFARGAAAVGRAGRLHHAARHAARAPAAAPVVQQEPPPEVLTPRMAQEADLLNRMATMQDRLYRVAAPLLINNADLCKGQARNLLGFTAKNRYSYPGDYNEAAHIAFGMGEHLQVTGVLNGSGAAQAGLKRGDRLLTAGSKKLPTGPNASTTAGSVFGPLLAASPSLALGIEREGENRKLTVPVTRACGFGIELGNADNVNAYNDGSRVMVTRGMLGFVRSDDELAFLLATGMAHSLLGHPASQRYAGTVGGIIDNLVKVQPDTSMLIGSGGIKAMQRRNGHGRRPPRPLPRRPRRLRHRRRPRLLAAPRQDLPRHGAERFYRQPPRHRRRGWRRWRRWWLKSKRSSLRRSRWCPKQRAGTSTPAGVCPLCEAQSPKW